MNCLVLLTALAVLLPAQSSQPLFDGKSLKGWTQCNGNATYRVKDGTITGKTAAGSPNSFLCTEREYGDFILELETKFDPRLNSGIQIRSHRYRTETTVHTFNELIASLHAGRLVVRLNGLSTVDLPDDSQGRKEGKIALQVANDHPTEILFRDIAVLEKN